MAETRPEYTVSSLTAALKRSLETGFSKIIVEGEISGWKRYPSGHCYFTLKDEGAQLPAVMFASPYEASCTRHPELREGLKDGAKVKVYGTITVYPVKGAYQINVVAVTLAGLGELMQRYLALKEKLTKEGLFDASRKRPLPTLPRRIAIVTSEAGAVFHDMCNVLIRRFPNVEIRLYPSLVQGEGAPATLIAGIEYFNACADWKADLLILARGGGSFEDLFCFNDEALVRALAASRIPTINAVGHEPDFTLCDFAADSRAGTPSIAAEIAVPVLAELEQRIERSVRILVSSLRGRGEFYAQRVDQLGDALGASLQIALSRAENRLTGLQPRLSPAMTLALERAAARLDRAEAKLSLLSPYSVLERGYSLTTAADGSVVRDAASLKEGDSIVTRFAAGEAGSTVTWMK